MMVAAAAIMVAGDVAVEVVVAEVVVAEVVVAEVVALAANPRVEGKARLKLTFLIRHPLRAEKSRKPNPKPRNPRS